MPHPSVPLSIFAALALSACASQPPAATPVAFSAPAPQSAAPSGMAGDEAQAVADNHIDVPFANGSSQLTREAEAKLDLAARLFRDAGPALLFSAGCTDAVGSEYSNLVLSAKRADVVKRALAARGIPQDRVQLRAFGESALAQPDHPNAANNRRVMITWRMA